MKNLNLEKFSKKVSSFYTQFRNAVEKIQKELYPNTHAFDIDFIFYNEEYRYIRVVFFTNNEYGETESFTVHIPDNIIEKDNLKEYIEKYKKK
jgi:hypothetical protein